MNKKLYDKKEIFISYLIPFTALFLVVQYLIFFVFYSKDITFIWNYDGAYQHYPALSYYSTILKSLLSGKGVPMVDFSIGQGFDVLTTLNYYVIGDPLTLISAVWNQNHMESLYDFLVVLRFYLAGISFLIFCIYKKKAPFPSLLGSFIYIFSGYALVAGLKHPFFLNPMIYLPLLLLGTERLLKQKRSLFFSIMIAISAMSNFYFFYMLTIIIFLYALIRFFDCYKEERLSTFFRILWRGILYYLLGILLSAILLLPMIYAFINNGRIDGASQDIGLLLYPISYYKRLYKYVFSLGFNAGNWSFISIGVTAAFGIYVAFTKKQKTRSIQILTLLAAMFLCIPFFGYLLNGFAYVSNRWTFALALLLAYIVTDTYEDLYQLSRKKQWILLLLCSMYCFVAFIFLNKFVKLPSLFLVAGAIFILINNYITIKPRYRNLLYLLFALCNIITSSYLYYSLDYHNYASSYLSKGAIKAYEHNDAIDYIKAIDPSFYRIQLDNTSNPNIAVLQDYYGTGYYFSIINKNVVSYMLKLENSSLRFACQYLDNDERSAMNALNCIKYFITNKESSVPFGFTKIDSNKEFQDGLNIYENQYYLPLGFTYNSYITASEYESLSALQKQEALMQSIVLSKDIKTLPKASLRFSTIELTFTLSFGEGMYMEGNSLHVRQNGSILTLRTNGKAYSETYLRLEGIDFLQQNSKSAHINSTSKEWLNKKIIVRTPKSTSYFGVTNYLVNLGYQAKPQHLIKLQFSKAGIYQMDSLKLYAQPMNSYKRRIENLNNNPLENIKESMNQISGTITTVSPSLLFLSIPYSTGWKASVDGKPVTLLKANTMYMALELDAGTHEVVLHYTTPYLREGAALSLLGAIIAIGLLAGPTIKKKRVVAK